MPGLADLKKNIACVYRYRYFELNLESFLEHQFWKISPSSQENI